MSAAPAIAAGERFFTIEAQRIARLCHAMSERFALGGRLIAIGCSAQGRSDARHVAVEFVHPVIVGKRALPAIALTAEPQRLGMLVEPHDMVIVFDGALPPSDALSIAYAPIGAAWEFAPPTEDPFVAQELAETHYHLLWELVHVFFEHRGRQAGTGQDGGAAAFLYPFLGAEKRDSEAVIADVAASVLLKSEEIAALRAQTLEENAGVLSAAAAALRERFERDGRLLALGNGGSATDAMDAVADCCFPPKDFVARAALDLSDDPAILTAIANDIGIEALFSRQVIAHGRASDALIAFSTSGGSANVIAALLEARKRGLATIALVGYDGGEIAAAQLADHVVVTRSQHIPRIQEAQASAWHALRELVG